MKENEDVLMKSNEKTKSSSKDTKFKMTRSTMNIISVVIVSLALIIALMYSISYIRTESAVEITGRIDTRANVFYMENDTFPTNPIPQNLYYLMSYTDYMEVENRLLADFGREVEVHYDYVSSKRLVIRYMATGDSNLNPIVFQKEVPLSEIQGSTTTSSLRFPNQNSVGNNGNEVWNIYEIFPREFIYIYLDFVTDQRRQMDSEGLVVRDIRGFSAELFVDYEYELYFPEFDLRQNITNGHRMSLSTEVYSIEIYGMDNFNGYGYRSSFLPQPNLLAVVIYVMIFLLGVYGLFDWFRNRKVHPNPQYQGFLDIKKKYANDIMEINEPLPIVGCTKVQVKNYEMLLKLAIDLNKRISCYYDNNYAEFVVVVDSYAYVYQITYNI
jgi:hypothetical protein